MGARVLKKKSDAKNKFPVVEGWAAAGGSGRRLRLAQNQARAGRALKHALLLLGVCVGGETVGAAARWSKRARLSAPLLGEALTAAPPPARRRWGCRARGDSGLEARANDRIAILE